MAEDWARPFDQQAAERQEQLAHGQVVMTAAEQEASAWPALWQDATKVVIPGLRDWIASLKPHTQPLASRRQLRVEAGKLEQMQTAHWTNRNALRVRMGNTRLRLRIAWAWITVHRLAMGVALLILFMLLLVVLVIYFFLLR